MNSKGAVVTNFILDHELETLESNLKVGVIKHKLNAAGNIILANDSAAMVHPGLDDSSIEMIKDVLDVEVEKGTIAGLNTVGAAAIVTNEGLLCHPKVTDSEKEALEDKAYSVFSVIYPVSAPLCFAAVYESLLTNIYPLEIPVQTDPLSGREFASLLHPFSW